MTVAGLLASIALSMPVPADVSVIRAPCPAMANASCASGTGTTIYLNVNPVTQPLAAKLTLSHELGHIWDLRHLNDADHAHFADLIGLHGHAWWFDPTDRVAPAERFADAVAWCGMGRRDRRELVRRGDYPGTYGETIPRVIVADTCWWLRHPPHSGSVRNLG